MLSEETEVDRAEAIGALNFLTIDDLPVEQEGVPLDPDSIIQLPVEKGNITFPGFCKSTDDPFLLQVEASGDHWHRFARSPDARYRKMITPGDVPARVEYNRIPQ